MDFGLFCLATFFFWETRYCFYSFYFPSGILELFSVFSRWLWFFNIFYDFFLTIFCFSTFYTFSWAKVSVCFLNKVDLTLYKPWVCYLIFYFYDLLVGLLEYLCFISDLSFGYLLNAGLRLFLTGLIPFKPPTEADLLILTYYISAWWSWCALIFWVWVIAWTGKLDLF